MKKATKTRVQRRVHQMAVAKFPFYDDFYVEHVKKPFGVAPEEPEQKNRKTRKLESELQSR